MNDRRKPNSMKIVTGSHRITRPGSPVPAALAGVPEAPEHLSPMAREAWDKIVPLLDQMGVITKADGWALARLVELYATVVELELDIRRHGKIQIVRTVAGGEFERKRPQVGMLAEADRRLRLSLCEFGLTAASRSKVQIAPKLDDDDEYFGTPKRGA